MSALADPGFSWPAAQELNVASLARDVGINGETLRSYLALLETIYLHVRLPAWSTNFTSRAKHHPKVHMVDTGLAANVLGLSAERLSTPTTQMAGPLFETLVVNELVRQQAWSEERVRLGHYRDREQREVDLILESGDGRVVAVEMKAARDVDEIYFRWVAYLRDRLGDLFINGIVIVATGSGPWNLGRIAACLVRLPRVCGWRSISPSSGHVFGNNGSVASTRVAGRRWCESSWPAGGSTGPVLPMATLSDGQ